MIPLDVRQLECFIAVAEERHVGHAAARLHMTQPPLTRRISRLEREIGAQLFVRTLTGVELTAAGLVLLDRAYRIVALAENTLERVRLADAGEAGALAVGYFGSTIFGLVPRLLRLFLDTRPEVRIVIERATRDMQAQAIRDGRMHIGFSRQYPAEPDLAVRNIASEPLYVALPETHPLLSKQKVLLADIQNEPLVLFPSAPRPGFADEVVQLLMRTGGEPRIEAEASDVVTALAYVAIAQLCAVVPRSASNIALPGVVYVPLADAPPESLSCIYRAIETPTLVRAFLDHLDLLDPATLDLYED
ncbi:LysR family transcriptional regulator (plasmid) [Rhodococcus opacus]|uniref:ClcR n=1 Tax=Rhodococcus opacus TaxID=37919 RepID=O67986_RHOOP|nr:LysR substrate-binding domain-containing protein [Rhodococcus opacus]AAC38250.1 ClcR [Rhodococcus opacus]ANS32246.1 LysR family transcriptional regulator [Rhodococcus opacus]ANS32340.1 LysR family transcriptional regulator [Rhodococcus opacus]